MALLERMIRPATAGDVAALGRIAYATGYFGHKAERFFPDERLFAELWVSPYLSPVGCCNFVAETERGVVGYVLGTCDLRAYGRQLAGLVPTLLGQGLRGAYPEWRGCVHYLLRTARYPSKHAPLDRYPAQLHINLLPGTRGQGLGSALLKTHLDCLRARGVSGVQLSTTRENEAALGLYQKFGFRVWLEYTSPLWRPWLGRDARHVVMVLEL